MSQPLILYDLTNTQDVPRRSWSPNCWKTRIVLNYKRIPYKTVWIHYADVQSAMKAIGAEPNVAKVVNGTPRYTLPTIFDPNTSNFITESFEIAKYLDQQYPERPVVPYGSEQELSTFAETFLPNYGMDLLKIAGYGSFNNLDSRDQASLESGVRAYDNGPPLADRHPQEEHWKGFEQALNRLSEVKLLNGKASAVGEAGLTFADLTVASFLKWLMVSVSEDEFERVLQWEDGRWKTFMSEVEPYFTVDEGESYS